MPPLRARPAVEAALIESWAARITEISCYADVQHTIELPAHAGLPQHHTARSNRSVTASTSTETRFTIPPTVRHATRINNVTAVFEHATASHVIEVPGMTRTRKGRP